METIGGFDLIAKIPVEPASWAGDRRGISVYGPRGSYLLGCNVGVDLWWWLRYSIVLVGCIR